MRGKRGQTSGGGAATLVGVIALLIVLYLVFVPSDVRVSVLDTTGGGPAAGGPGAIVNKTLLLEHPGRIEVLDQRDIDHQLPTVNLFSTTQAALLKSLKSVFIKNGVFDQQSVNFSFPLENVENANNAMISFNSKGGKGVLFITLNGRQIFGGEIQGFNTEPIDIPKDLLQKDNTVQISVSSVGWKFWQTNQYTLSDLKITADLTDKSTQESKTVFLVSSTEKDNIERAFVKFFPDCVAGTVGTLDVFLNNHNIFSAVPDCGILRPLEVSPFFLISGENTMGFKTNKGVYLIDQISMHSQLKQASFPVYYFDLDQASFDAIRSGAGNLVLYLDFVDDITQKTATIFVNGKPLNVNTKNKQYFASISLFVDKGSNAIEVIPRAPLDIVNLEVDLE